MKHPDDCGSMSELRALIDRIDTDLVALLALRQGCIDRAAVLKRAEGLPARIPDRVEQVVAKVRASAEAQECDPELAERLWRELIEWAIAREDAALAALPRGQA